MALNTNNYHYTNAPITEYTERHLKRLFESNGYLIKKFECEASIMQRMNRVNLFFIVNASFEKDGKSLDLINLDNYSTYDEIEEEFRNEVTCIFTEYKKTAISDNKHYVLVEQNSEEQNKETTPEQQADNTKEKQNENRKIVLQYYLSCKASDLKSYLLDDEKINVWTRNNYKIKEKDFTYHDDIHFNNVVTKDSKILCRMVFKGLDVNSGMTIDFIEDSWGTSVEVAFKDIDDSIILTVENLLFERVFLPMSFCFNFKVVRKTLENQ